MRPRDGERCTVCVESLQQCDAGDFGHPGKTHLQFMYDKRIATHCHGLSQDMIDAHFRDYALNRMLAPFRDNLRKGKGEKASRTYESRNLKGAKALANLCGFQRPGSVLRCIRSPHPSEPNSHKF